MSCTYDEQKCYKKIILNILAALNYIYKTNKEAKLHVILQNYNKFNYTCLLNRFI